MRIVEDTQTKADRWRYLADLIFYRVKFIAFLVRSQDPRIKIRAIFPRYDEYNNKIDLHRILIL